jgi:hypothetical protein
LDEEYRSWSSSLWSFLHSPVTLSLLGPIFSSIPYSQTVLTNVWPFCLFYSWTQKVK